VRVEESKVKLIARFLIKIFVGKWNFFLIVGIDWFNGPSLNGWNFCISGIFSMEFSSPLSDRNFHFGWKTEPCNECPKLSEIIFWKSKIQILNVTIFGVGSIPEVANLFF
jgi:hypothetical protein